MTVKNPPNKNGETSSLTLALLQLLILKAGPSFNGGIEFTQQYETEILTNISVKQKLASTSDGSQLLMVKLKLLMNIFYCTQETENIASCEVVKGVRRKIQFQQLLMKEERLLEI